jgi:hypothetical protein
MLVQSTENFGVDRLKCLVIAPAGHGKTTLAKTTGESTIVISAEAGLLVLKDHKIAVLDITTDDKQQMIPKERRIARLFEAYKYLCSKEAQELYKWVVVDSLTEIGQNLVEQLQAEYPDRKDALVMWGEYNKQMRSLIKAFRDLPYYNVLMTALSEREKDEHGQFSTGVSLNGKISQQLPAYFDEVFYLDVFEDPTTKERQRRLLTQPTGSIVAKDRSSKLDQYEPADIALIAAKIRKG